jgi:hypothetical protein
VLTSMTTDCGDRDVSVTLTKTRGLLQQTHCSPTPVGQPAKTDAAAPRETPDTSSCRRPRVWPSTQTSLDRSHPIPVIVDVTGWIEAVMT